MITKQSSDKEILDHELPNAGTIRDITSITFVNWVAGKLNGLPAFKAATVELTALVSSPPLGSMPEGEKVKIIRKLLELEVKI